MIFLLFISCQNQQISKNDEIVVGIEIAPEQSDPRKATDAISQKINRLIFSSLMVVNDDLNMVCDLCKSVQQTSPTTYTFNLKTSAAFHNGQKLTSEDIKETINSITQGDFYSPYKQDLLRIQSIETTSPHSITFRLKQPYSSFLTLMALPILPHEVAKLKNLNPEDLVGSGPFKMRHDLRTPTRIVLDRVSSDTTNQFNRIIFRVVQDNTLRTLEFIKGRLDFIQNGIPYVLADYLRKQPGVHFKKSSGINFSYLAFNFKHPALSQLKVRQAIAMAINREQLVLYKLMGFGELATSVLSPKHFLHNKDLKRIRYKPQSAAQLLDEAGFPDPDGIGPKTRFDLIYKTSTNKERLAIAHLIAEDLKQIGIGVKVVAHEFGTFFQDIRQGQFDLFSLTWVGVSDAAIYDMIAHTKNQAPQGANRGYFSDKEMDQLLDKALTTTNKEEQKELYLKIQKIFFEKMAYVPLWYENNFVFMNQKIHNYKITPNASYMGLIEAHN